MPTVVPQDGAKVGNGCGKEALAAADDKLIVESPPVVRIRPVVVEPQPVVVTFEVEHVQVAIGAGVSALCHPVHRPSETRAGCICLCDHKSLSTEHQVFPFLNEQHTNPLREVAWPE